ncbi:isoaspartyl peptidase/L-asparaginase [Trinickia caryophylli]|uniref:Isoaspartyl peptidase n=1 Tax=Trinickia caryophylli TaxID=28094 RepID=A0A1X7H927_TRICW|nr:isoaspartyl peptidase/L-asparaginase [Trinickia caryophylli]PMS09024.1 isoaspartyl peptidase/L-asparaginase [Trinickia caryophylli]TRX14854.1 isoaspartyl peptidase/L-asparaginase [Trinickia caryophylli]WQE14704.1 isoaspartyl peptidase/L-asparaginase [Trinickia caryophylli]SMF81864.1 beta-aspartyl-peptidase (threonine type) [Trinickia caryophylli]GLU31867.1 isoaspartyl peptidase/L-asparaginase [Trinickia caryophylli]
MKRRPVLAIHGGAGTIVRHAMTDEAERAYLTALGDVLRAGEQLLARGGSALDAVCLAVRLLEDCPLFNAGRGAVYTAAGTHELDAAIMDGRTLAAGAVCGVTRAKNPILAARRVLEASEHVMFAGPGADAFVQAQGLECVEPAYFGTEARYVQWLNARHAGRTMLDHDAARAAAQDPGAPEACAPIDPDRKLGTVGAVALDADGHLAAATSTGGMTNKQPGRVGDSPIIGAGCYANDATCAVSTTGTGETFMRLVAAHDVSARMAYGGATLAAAAETVVMERLAPIGGSGGLVAVDADGNVALPFNTEGMYRGFVRAGDGPSIAIYRTPRAGAAF